MIIRLCEQMRVFNPDQLVTIHVQIPAPEKEYCIYKTARDMWLECANAQQHQTFWKLSIYNRQVEKLTNNIDCIEVWLKCLAPEQSQEYRKVEERR